MKRHRLVWSIAGITLVLALTASFARLVLGGFTGAPTAERAERDRLVGKMIEMLGRDHRARFAETRALAKQVEKYCDSAGLASAETWYARGLRQFYGDDDTTGAEESFARSERLRPEWAWPVNAMGTIAFVAGRRDEALRLFARALALEPGWSRPHSEMAILYRRAGDLGKALSHAEQALALEPEDLVNLFNYGVVLDDLGRRAEARALYERVLAAAPDMAQAEYNLACSYAREGDAGKALPYLKRAIAGDPAFRKDAVEDADFDPIRKTAAFRRAVAGKSGPRSP